MKRHGKDHARWLALVAVVACCAVMFVQAGSAAAQTLPALSGAPRVTATQSSPRSSYAQQQSATLPDSKSALKSVYIREATPPATSWISDAPRQGTSAREPSPNLPPAAGQPRASERAPQTLWLLSTRRLVLPPGVGDPAQFLPDVWRYVAATGWAASSLDELLRSGSPATVRGIFIHGNDTSPEEASEDGLQLFRQLRASVGPAFEMQCIIWSWPTVPPTTRVRQTAQANANRTNTEGFLLASFLSRFGHESSISLAGYCSGARVATGGLHVLGGGEIEGRQLALDAAAPPRKIHATLLAPAVDNDWLTPGGKHDRALTHVERMAITVNADDPVLKFYPLLWGRRGPPALGVTGVADPARLGTSQAKVAQLNFAPAIERSHGWKYYAESPEVIALLRQELLQRPQAVAKAPGTQPTR